MQWHPHGNITGIASKRNTFVISGSLFLKEKIMRNFVFETDKQANTP